MSRFTEKASTRVDRLSDEQIIRLINNQSRDLKIRDSVLDSLTVGLILADKTGKILYTNKYVKYLLPVTDKDSRVSTYIQHHEVLKFVEDCLKKHLDAKDMFFEHSNPMMGDMSVRIITTSIPQTDQVVFLLRDYTFLNKIKDEYKKNESLAALTTMAAGVAHEIKNPLASISIYLQILSRKLDKDGLITKEDAQKSLDVINQEIERLNKMAVDFLYAVKPINIHQALCDINTVAQKTYEVCKAECEANNVSLELDLSTSLPKTFIDVSLIEQCVLNLVRNALQAIKDDSTERKVRIFTYLDGNDVKLSVSDTGCGISNQAMERIFEPYYTTKASGTGLGLTNIFKIMKEHSGEVTVQSEVDKGSTFTLTIPVPNSERFRIE